LAFGILFGFVAIRGIVMHLIHKRIMAKFGLPCPGCGKPLVPLNGSNATSQILIATGKCGHCGATLIQQ
jgi:hypothetical protein